MEKWICKVCDFSHIGETAPENCPICGAPKSQFRKEGKNSGCAYNVVLIVVLLGIAAYLIYSCSSSATVDNTVVKNVDLNRYLGKWYEIARFDHSFERSMQQCTAIYSLQPNGKIKVVNEGTKDGKRKQSVGKAKLTDEPGVLRVSFFGPFYSDYRILMLAPDYSYALVGSDSDNYLWILSRTPKLMKQTIDKLVSDAKRRGYNTDKLIWVEHE